MAEIGKLTVAIEADNSGLSAGLADSTKKVSSAFSEIGKTIAGAAASAGIFATLVNGIQFNAAAESAQMSFEVMLGSAEAAKDMLAELKDFANTTPLEFADIRDASQTLLAFGLDAGKAIDTVKMLGDVSGGNAEKLKSLSVVFGQISANGRLTGGDLLQLVNAGFNPLQEIAERTGKSMGDLRKEMEAGQISFAMVEESFKKVTSEGGRFYGMLEKQAGTLNGKLSTLSDAWDTFTGALTEAFTGPLKGLVDIATNLLSALTGMDKGLLAFIGTLGAGVAAVLALSAAASALGVALPAAFGPIGIAIAAVVAGLVAIGVHMAGLQTQLNDSAKDIHDAFGDDKTLTDFSKRLARAQDTLLDMQQNGIEITSDRIEKMAKSVDVSSEALAQFILKTNGAGQAMRDAAQSMTDVKIVDWSKQMNITAAENAAEKFAAKQTELSERRKKQQEEEAKRQEDMDKKRLDDLKNIRRLEDDAARARMMIDSSRLAAAASIFAREKEEADLEKKSYEINLAYEQELAATTEKNNQDRIQQEIELQSELEATAEQLDATGEKSTRGLEGFQAIASGVLASLRAIGGEGAETLGQIGSLAVNVITAIATKGKDTQAIFGAIQDAIGLAFEATDRATMDVIEGLEEEKLRRQETIEALKLQKDVNGELSAETIAAIEAEEAAIESLNDSIETEEASTAQATFTEKLNETVDTLIVKLAPALNVIKAALESLIPVLELIGNIVQILSPIFDVFTTIINELSNGIKIIADLFAGKSGDYTFGEILTGILNVLTGGVSGGIEVALGKPQEKLAGGTDFAAGGATLVGEQGPEIVNLPRGSQVVPNYAIGDTMAAGGGATINIYSPVAVDPSEASSIMSRTWREMAYMGA